MKNFCDNPCCENISVKKVPVSVSKPCDQMRALCAACEEAYTWGVQHGRMTARRGRLWILAVADRGMIVHVRVYCSKAAVEKGLVDYLRKYHGYGGGDDAQAVHKWLSEHDERLSVDIVQQDIHLEHAKRHGSGSKSVGLTWVTGFLNRGGFLVLAENRQDPDPGAPVEAWAYEGPLDFQSAVPVTFGVGASIHDVLDALNHQLARHQDGITKPGIGKRFPLIVDKRELATILAALRFHQDENLQGGCDIPDQAIRGIATDDGLLKPLDFNEVGHLCERINVDEKPINWKTCQHDWQDTPGPETGCGAEYWFRCSRCGAVKYRCVEQDGSYSDQIQPPEESSGAGIVSLPPLGLIIKAPPDDGSEEPLLRVVYVVDAPGADAYEAAEFTHQIMSDSNSLRPVLHIIDPTGNTTTVDMSEDDVQK